MRYARPSLLHELRQLADGFDLLVRPACRQFLGHEEGKLQRLAGVQTRVAGSVVAVRQVFVLNGADTTSTFCHILTGHLKVDTTGHGALGPMYRKEFTHFAQYGIERAAFYSRLRI